MRMAFLVRSKRQGAGVIYTGPTVVSGTLSGVVSNALAAASLVGDQGNGAPYTFSSSDLPAWLTLNANGSMSGTPTGAGTATFHVTCTDRNGIIGAPVAVSITVSSAPTATTPTLGATQGTPMTPVVMVGSGGTGGAYTFTSSDMPAGLTISAGGSISGNPSVSGGVTFHVTVTDVHGYTGTVVYSGSIAAASGISATIPTISNAFIWAPVPQVSMSTPVGGAGAPYTYTSSDLPAGLALSSAGAFNGVPSVSGTSTFHVTVTDHVGGTGVVAGSITISSSVDNLPIPDLTGKVTVYAEVDLSGVTDLAGLVAAGYNTGNPVSGAADDRRNQRDAGLLGSNRVFTDGPGGAHGARTLFNQGVTTLNGAINAVQTTFAVHDTTGIRDPAIWGAGASPPYGGFDNHQEPQIVIDSEGMTITAISAPSGPGTVTVVRGTLIHDSGLNNPAATHVDNSAISIFPQESHNYGFGWSDTQCGPKTFYTHWFERCTHVNYPTETIDMDHAHRAVGGKGAMHFPGGPLGRSQFFYGGVPLSRYGMPIFVEGDGGTGIQYYGDGTGGGSAAQCIGPWPYELEGSFAECFTAERNNTTNGSNDGFAYMWKRPVGGTWALIIAVSPIHIGRVVPGAMNVGSDPPPKWSYATDLSHLTYGASNFTTMKWWDARAIGQSRVYLDFCKFSAYRDP